jgi:hypothetical protein
MDSVIKFTRFHDRYRERRLVFMEQLRCAGQFDWLIRARQRYTKVYTERFKRRFDDLGPYFRRD